MKTIHIETVINSPLQKVWKFWNEPEHITHWAFASDTWECPHAENDLQEGGKFLTRMSAKDCSATFDLIGTYTHVVENEKIEYTLADERKVKVEFVQLGDSETKVSEDFEIENENPEEMQRAGWQSILDTFKRYVEEH